MNLVSMQQTETMSSREMANLCQKRHDSVKRTIDLLVFKEVISQPQIVDGEKSANGVIEQVYNFGKRDSYVIVAQLSPEFTARLVDRWQELESQQVKSLNLNDPATLRSLLIGYTEQVEQLTIERDTAIATKAQISDRKTATALNTASQAVKRANKLESEIGRCINHATILAVRNATGTEYAWQPLRKYCKAFDIDTNVVHDERYGKVKSYPARAWMAVHGVDINVLFGE